MDIPVATFASAALASPEGRATCSSREALPAWLRQVNRLQRKRRRNVPGCTFHSCACAGLPLASHGHEAVLQRAAIAREASGPGPQTRCFTRISNGGTFAAGPCSKFSAALDPLAHRPRQPCPVVGAGSPLSVCLRDAPRRPRQRRQEARVVPFNARERVVARASSDGRWPSYPSTMERLTKGS